MAPREDAAQEERFSDELEQWLSSDQPKTIMGLGQVFGEKSIAVVVAVLMTIPALPLPTGGITHIFEIIVLLLVLELIVGRREVWLPERWRRRKLGSVLSDKAIPMIMRRIRWFERHSHPRMPHLLDSWPGRAAAGVAMAGFTLVAFLAPPFSGLDTLPSLGTVTVALGMILEDVLIMTIGLVIGLAGVGLVVGLSGAVLHFAGSLF